MPLYQQIEEHLKDAMRSQEKERLSALRNIKSFLKNKSIELKRDLKDEEVVQGLATLAKQRRESIESYQQAGREDLVNKEENELKVINEYLPKALSSEELDQLVREAIEATQAKGPQDMGKVMKALMPKTTGRADGKEVSSKVKALLAG